MVLPTSDAVRPGGRLLAVRLLYGPVPAVMPMVPLKPPALTVQAADDNVPSAGAGFTVMLNVPLLVAPQVSLTVSWTLPYVPAVVGVPVKTTFDPTTEALRPG